MWCRVGNWFANVLRHLLFYKESIFLGKRCDMNGPGIQKFKQLLLNPNSFKQVWALKENPERHGAFLEWSPHLWAQHVLPKRKILLLSGEPPRRRELRRGRNPRTAVRRFQLSSSLSRSRLGELGSCVLRLHHDARWHAAGPGWVTGSGQGTGSISGGQRGAEVPSSVRSVGAPSLCLGGVGSCFPKCI